MKQTEYPFTLSLGYKDERGVYHSEGVMRLATAADEILPLGDRRVRNNPAYLVVILLSRVITHLGALDVISPKVIEELCVEDFNYLQHLYNTINGIGPDRAPMTCPECGHKFEVEQPLAGES